MTDIVSIDPAHRVPLAFSVPDGDMPSALAAGCPVVIKAHASYPATSNLCHALLSGAPPAIPVPRPTPWRSCTPFRRQRTWSPTLRSRPSDSRARSTLGGHC
jgi:hypothetical protein